MNKEISFALMSRGKKPRVKKENRNLGGYYQRSIDDFLNVHQLIKFDTSR